MAKFTPADPKVILLPGRNIELDEGFAFLDPTGLDWPVPKGTVADGASIPQVFWSIIGGPLDGPYRNASIIHDYYCDMRTRTWQATHRMFYDAMIACDVDPTKAKIMYFAVRWGGPRWEERVSINTNLGRGGHAADFGMDFAGGGDEEGSGFGGGFVDGEAGEPTVTISNLPPPNAALSAQDRRQVADEIKRRFQAHPPSLDDIDDLAETTRPILD